jgi:peptidoglycan/LPS O-acetylase OafA/YrhL
MVVATHFDRGQVTEAGIMGVTVFFTLSGFLITTVLLVEHERTGRISRLGFYRRRALRLFPALAVMLFVVCLLTLAGFPTDVTGGMVAAVVGYVSNWYLMATADGGVHWGALGHTWSLAIEEQFYIVWPFVVMLALRRGRRVVLSVAMVGAASSMTWALVSGRSTLASDVSAYGLLAGCALAAWMHGRTAVRPPWWLAVVALLPLLALAPSDARTVAYVSVPLLTCVALWVAVQGDGGWLSVRPLVWVGKRSYGLYLWHVPVAYLCGRVAGPWLRVSGVGILVSVGLTVLSWRYVETPFLRLKDRSAGSDSGRGERAGRAVVAG